MNNKTTTDNELRKMLKQANEYMRGDTECAKKAIPLYFFVLKEKDTVSVAKYIVPRMTYCICKIHELNTANDFYEKMIRRYGNSVEDPELTIRMARSYITTGDVITAMKLVSRLERLNRTDLRERIYALKKDSIYNGVNKRKHQKNTVEKQKPKRKRKRRNQLPPLSKPRPSKVDYKPVAHRGDYTDVPSDYKGAEPVKKSPSKPLRLRHTEAVLKARKFLDSELYPYGMRYGDATRYRRKKRRK